MSSNLKAYSQGPNEVKVFVVSVGASNSPSHFPTFTPIALRTHCPGCSFSHNIYLPVSTHVGISGIISSCLEKSGLAGILWYCVGGFDTEEVYETLGKGVSHEGAWAGQDIALDVSACLPDVWIPN